MQQKLTAFSVDLFTYLLRKSLHLRNLRSTTYWVIIHRKCRTWLALGQSTHCACTIEAHPSPRYELTREKLVAARGSQYYNSNSANPNTHTGAVVGEPNANDLFNDARTDYSHLEPTTYINAAMVGSLAAVITKHQTVPFQNKPPIWGMKFCHLYIFLRCKKV